jgi:hypothetical protein
VKSSNTHRDAINMMWLGTGLLLGAWLGSRGAALVGGVVVLSAAIVLTITQLALRRP